MKCLPLEFIVVWYKLGAIFKFLKYIDFYNYGENLFCVSCVYVCVKAHFEFKRRCNARSIHRNKAAAAAAAVMLLFELQQDQDNATSPTLAVSFQFEWYIVYGRVCVCEFV